MDIEAHASDKEIRSTLLHEMAHAAAGSGSTSHGSHFWEQIEHLLQKGAPISVGSSETGGLSLVRGVVPATFPLARQALNRAQKIEERKIRQWAKSGEFDGEDVIDQNYVVERFEEAATTQSIDSPETAALVVGAELGLTDIDGKPLDAWAERVLAKGKKAFSRQRLLLKHRSILKGAKS